MAKTKASTAATRRKFLRRLQSRRGDSRCTERRQGAGPMAMRLSEHVAVEDIFTNTRSITPRRSMT